MTRTRASIQTPMAKRGSSFTKTFLHQQLLGVMGPTLDKGHRGERTANVTSGRKPDHAAVGKVTRCHFVGSNRRERRCTEKRPPAVLDFVVPDGSGGFT